MFNFGNQVQLQLFTNGRPVASTQATSATPQIRVWSFRCGVMQVASLQPRWYFWFGDLTSWRPNSLHPKGILNLGQLATHYKASIL